MSSNTIKVAVWKATIIWGPPTLMFEINGVLFIPRTTEYRSLGDIFPSNNSVAKVYSRKYYAANCTKANVPFERVGETDVPVEVLRRVVATSDPDNAHVASTLLEIKRTLGVG